MMNVLFKKAIEDYKTAIILFQTLKDTADESFLSPLCFHLQQCIEKTLKDYILNKGVDYKKTHDITSLCEEVENLYSDENSIENKLIKQIDEYSTLITTWSVNNRYLDSFSSLIDNVQIVIHLSQELLKNDPYKTYYKEVYSNLEFMNNNKNEKKHKR